MSATTSPTVDAARALLRKNATLAVRLAALASRGTAAAAALAAPGTPPPDTLLRELADARRDFTALRDEALTAATALGLPTPPPQTIDSTRDLEAILKALVEAAAQAEQRAVTATALAKAVAVLDGIAALAHRDDPAFAALAACQSRAADVRAALAASGTLDAAATMPFASLLVLMDRQQSLDDEEWGALQDAVAAAFGRPLAVAAMRGKLVRQSPGRSETG